jgi:hypothetical protein
MLQAYDRVQFGLEGLHAGDDPEIMDLVGVAFVLPIICGIQ